MSSPSGKIFLSYKRHIEPDHGLATYLHQRLVEAGHAVFIDTAMRVGTAWLEEIDRQIQPVGLNCSRSPCPIWALSIQAVKRGSTGQLSARTGRVSSRLDSTARPSCGT
jgi:hypothetical protein